MHLELLGAYPHSQLVVTPGRALLLGGLDVPDASVLRILHLPQHSHSVIRDALAKHELSEVPKSAHPDITGTCAC